MLPVAMSAPIMGFLTELSLTARPVGRGSYAFVAPDGSCRGFVQIIPDLDRVAIHRLWTRKPGGGNGTFILRALCELADRHGIELTLKPLPIGRKPYPLKRDQLQAWYQRHGFVGTRRKMLRPPAASKPQAPS
jgi:hypothetical protein